MKTWRSIATELKNIKCRMPKKIDLSSRRKQKGTLQRLSGRGAEEYDEKWKWNS